MKKVISVLLFAAALVFVSCESTKQEGASEQTESASSESRAQKGKNSDKGSKSEGQSSPSAASASTQFKKFLEESAIEVVSFPKETVKGKAFSSAYKIKVALKDGTPAAGASVTAEYPASRSAESVAYAKAALVTDEKGTAEFSAPVPSFAASEKVLFYPTSPSSDPELVRLASAASEEAPWKVRSNLGARTGILVSIVDYRQNGAINLGNGAQPSAQALTSDLWRAGLMGAQNADFHNSIDADDPARIRNDALKQLNGNSLFKFVVYGRVKYSEPITKDADGYYKVSFNGSLGALNISSGEVVVKASKSVTVRDKSEWKAVQTAQQEMAKLFCQELLYSLSN